MEVRLISVRIMDIELGAHSAVYKIALDIIMGQGDLLLLIQLFWQREVCLSGKLCFCTFLRFLDVIP